MKRGREEVESGRGKLEGVGGGGVGSKCRQSPL